MPDQEPRVLLLRHGEVASHRGDVPVTQAGLEHAERSGAAIGSTHSGPFAVMYGGTRRTRETAEALVRGIGDQARVDGPHDGFALRNPDMYVSGTRVNMVSSAAALAEQVPGMTAEQAAQNSWWTSFFASPDRIGWWLGQDDPPGETSTQLAERVRQFARSIADPGPLQGCLVVAVTHSPLIRSVMFGARGSDPGEPAYSTGVDIRVGPGGDVAVQAYDPLGR